MPQENKLCGSIRNWTRCFRSIGLKAFQRPGRPRTPSHCHQALAYEASLRPFPRNPFPWLCLLPRHSLIPVPRRTPYRMRGIHVFHSLVSRQKIYLFFICSIVTRPPIPGLTAKRLRLIEFQVAISSFLPICSVMKFPLSTFRKEKRQTKGNIAQRS